MKTIILTLSISLAALVSSAQQSKSSVEQSKPSAEQSSKSGNPDIDSRGYLVKIGDKAPDKFSLLLQDGSRTSLKELKGKLVILQFTASWCEVCREEMPYLERDIWQAYKDKGVVLIGVDRDEPIEVVQKFHKDMNISYPLALDPGAAIFQQFADKKAGVTRNVVIDREGHIRFLTRLYTKEEFAKLVTVVDELSKN